MWGLDSLPYLFRVCNDMPFIREGSRVPVWDGTGRPSLLWYAHREHRAKAYKPRTDPLSTIKGNSDKWRVSVAPVRALVISDLEPLRPLQGQTSRTKKLKCPLKRR